MAIPTKPTYTHGSDGTEPSVARDYANGDPLDADEFDYYVNTPFEKIKGIIDTLNNIDSGTLQVGDAATADDATNVTATYKGNDIDSDGDGQVDNADTADDATNVTATYKNNDIDTDGDGIVDQSDDTLLYKGNDIDTDGDGNVDHADFADDAETVDGWDKADIQTWVNSNADVPEADNADTVNGAAVFVQSTAPTGESGDIWFETA
jgi:hypothetical protein